MIKPLLGDNHDDGVADDYEDDNDADDHDYENDDISDDYDYFGDGDFILPDADTSGVPSRRN